MNGEKDSVEKVKKRFYKEAAKTFLVFAVTAILGAGTGAAIDFYFDSWPIATFILLGVFYFISWGVILKTGMGIKNTDEQEDKTTKE